MESTPTTRKQFLRNITLASIATSLVPFRSMGKTIAPEPTKTTNCVATTLDYYGQGPFYTAGAPFLSAAQLAPSGEPGTPLIISGQVRNLDCSQILPNTLIDVWHANDAGAYDNSGYHLRGKLQTNSQGFYLFRTVVPGRYLNGSQYRPSHIHFKITPPGFPTLTTQLYFEGDPYISVDAAASITSGNYDASGRIIPLTTNGNGEKEGTWDIVLDGTGTLGTEDPRLNLGMIYDVAPNPFQREVSIRYGVFAPSNVSLQIFDMNGKLVAELEKQRLQPQKYVAVWQPADNVPVGHYFIALKVNDLQVHYLKLYRTKG